MQPVSGNLCPDLLTHLAHASLVLRLPREMHLSRSSSNTPRLPSFLKLLQNFHLLLTFDRCTIPCACHAKPHPNVQKCSVPSVFALLTSKCASRHNGVHFFDMSTSKSGPNISCFLHFDLEMCFGPQRRALFRHHNFQKWYTACVFSTKGNVLRATTACNSSDHMAPHPPL